MNKAQRPKYCWDTTVFLAWISAEEGSPLDDIELVADEVDANRADLIVSAIVYSEILDAKNSKKAINQFQQFLKRSNVLSVDLTIGIAQKAADIRSKALKSKEKRKLRVPDASVIATAIVYGADVLHSLDPHILNLNGSIMVDGLKICLPRLITGQKALPGIISSDVGR
jgi:predicted nucleic acid-binding protein